MKEELILFETAKLAYEKGFDIECERYFNEDGEMWTYNNWGSGLSNKSLFRPSQSLLQRWLREEHEIHIEPSPDEVHDWQWDLYDLSGNVLNEFWREGLKSYEEALEKGLQEALKLVS